MNRKAWLLVGSFIMATLSYTQTGYKKLISPSPNAAAFDVYGNTQVSTYTGVPNIQIPIYTIVNKDISVPISLSYHAGGVKVLEEASRVGLGWVLNCGGLINRVVNDCDDFTPTYGYVNSTFPELFDYSVTTSFRQGSSNISDINWPAGATCSRQIMNQTVNLLPYLPAQGTPQANTYDLEPDRFSYNFLGYSGAFTLRKDRQVVKQSPDALDIALINADGTSWAITTPDGTQYIFDKVENCKIESTGPPTPYQITTWYLSKIVSLSGAEVDFHYTIGPLGASNSSIQTYNQLQQKTIIAAQGFSGGDLCPTGTIYNDYPPHRLHNLVLLDEITYPFGKVRLEYSDRLDVSGDKRISRIHMDNIANPAFSRSYELQQDYFTANTSAGTYPVPLAENFYTKRLKLTGIVETDNSQVQGKKYAFLYNEELLPAKNSFTHDHWGYFNGVPNSTFIPKISFYYPFGGTGIGTYQNGADRSVNPSRSQAFILTQIQYPTGGKTLFEYEQNDFDYAESIPPLQQGTASNFLETGSRDALAQRGVDQTFALSIPYIESGMPVILNVVSTSGQPNGYPPPSQNDAYLEFYPEGSTTPVHTLPLGDILTWTSQGGNYYSMEAPIYLPAGNYTVKSHIGNNVLFLNYVQYKFKWYFDPNQPTNHSIGLAGGLRVRKITDIDGITNANVVRRFKYDYEQDNNGDGVPERYSYGKRLAPLRYINKEIVQDCDATTNAASLCQTVYIHGQDYSYSASPIVGYSKVIVLYGENGENGKTEVLYENVPNLSVPYNANTMGITGLRPLGVPDIVNLQNGLLKQQTDYRYTGSAYQKATEVVNEYTSSVELTQLALRRVIAMPSQTGSNGAWMCSPHPCTWILALYPALQTSWSRLKSETNRIYSSADQSFVESKTEYTYESGVPVHYQPLKVTQTNSAGKKQHAYSLYASDYPSGIGFTDAMRTANVLASAIETVTTQEDNAGNISILKGSLSRFKQSNPSLLETIDVLENAAPVPLNSFKFSNRALGVLPESGVSTAFEPDTRYKPQMTFTYNAANNLTQQLRTFDMSKAYIWGYNNTLPIAEAVNAFMSEIFFTSFEENGTPGPSHTGNKYFSGDYSLDFTPPNNRVYKYSYWYRLGGVWKFSGELTYSGPIVLTNGDAIDDLKLFPEGAQMTTYTYEPLVGITSQADIKNNVTYYEYDSFNRLKFIRDNDKNILKAFEYKYQQQQ